MNTLEFDELKEIIEIAMDQQVTELDLDTDLYESVGMDSMGAVAMVVEIQRRHRVRIPEDKMPELRTPRLVLGFVNTPAPDEADATPKPPHDARLGDASGSKVSVHVNA